MNSNHSEEGLMEIQREQEEIDIAIALSMQKDTNKNQDIDFQNSNKATLNLQDRLKQANLERLRRRGESIEMQSINSISTQNVYSSQSAFSSSQENSSNQQELFNSVDIENNPSHLLDNSNSNLPQLNDQLSQQSQSQEQRQQKRKCDLYMNILAIVMVLLQGNIDCGISIQYWLFVYFCIQSLMIGASFLDDYIRESQFFNQQHRSLKKFIKITKVILLEGSLCGWILYGNSMFNESNTCYEKVPILAYMMLFLLILGFFQLLLYAVIVAVIICYFAAQCKRDMRKQVGSVKILKSLTRTKFNYQLFNEADECAICWNSYTEQDEVAKLKCNEKHYYHSACIESWIKAGNNTCPMCREPIDRNIQI